MTIRKLLNYWFVKKREGFYLFCAFLLGGMYAAGLLMETYASHSLAAFLQSAAFIGFLFLAILVLIHLNLHASHEFLKLFQDQSQFPKKQIEHVNSFCMTIFLGITFVSSGTFVVCDLSVVCLYQTSSFRASAYTCGNQQFQLGSPGSFGPVWRAGASSSLDENRGSFFYCCRIPFNRCHLPGSSAFFVPFHMELDHQAQTFRRRREAVSEAYPGYGSQKNRRRENGGNLLFPVLQRKNSEILSKTDSFAPKKIKKTGAAFLGVSQRVRKRVRNSG